MQLEQEFEEKQMVLHEKQDLEGLVGTLCEQVGDGNASDLVFPDSGMRQMCTSL